MKKGTQIVAGCICALLVIAALAGCADPEPDPFAPDNFRVEADEETGALQLRWDDSMQLDIFRAESEAALATVEKLDIESGAQSYTGYTDLDVVPGTTYYYRGRKMGEESWPFTDVVSITCPQFTPKIREFNVEQNGSSAVITWEIAFWDGGGDIPRLWIEKRVRGTTQFVTYTSYSENQYLADNIGAGEQEYTTLAGALQPDTDYTFTMKVFPADSFEPYATATDDISIAHNYSLVPTNITVSKTGTDSISINWTNAADADYYHVLIDGSEVTFAGGQPTAGPIQVQLDPIPTSGRELTIRVGGGMQANDHTGWGTTTFTW